ncbi:hypothetical protein C900_03555 [Fulvivirga imtechensis AK7]|uniref:DUF922 domain-containing protein n=2 Tax=Fulvivirga TaxID=396811 RepID=L8JSV1_9BACT|nr:hypothetical protein C900_03555 [Fulvivirga imtechensis AK7]
MAQTDSQKYIEWTPSYQLNWNDFAGQPGAGAIGDAGTAVAIKAKPYIEKSKIHYIVHALFDKHKSWYRDKSPSLLAHEQLHFDLAELYARKARKKIIEIALTGETDLKVYNQAVQKILNESNMIDRQYDAETLHGSITKKQQEWKERVDKELIALQSYTDQRVDLK